MDNIRKILLFMLVSIMITAAGCGQTADQTGVSDAGDQDAAVSTAEEQVESVQKADEATTETAGTKTIEDIPAFSDSPYVEIDNNEPDFSKVQLTTKSYESYSEIDSLGRCGTAEACVGRGTMPTDKRGSIGMIKPAGWHTIKYDSVDGKYLYNRCHLIGYQLTGENANEENLITGTRYMNVDGMLPFENEVADYVESTGNHVMYRVTPVYEKNDLLASGVQMEAESVEDKGEGVSFNIYAYNEQPGITIDHATGDSRGSGRISSSAEESSNVGPSDAKGTYVVNLNTKKFHKPSCYSVKTMSDSNKKTYKGKKQSLIDNGYEPCKNCDP
ncbi:MAG: DNA/RNA non-specific endonuclease [Eubacteriaceae bacterium]|nr:DNA/RNA non-specific endonuclease [Eubacteriaceae bacterium]